MRTFNTDQIDHKDIDSNFIPSRPSSNHPPVNTDSLLLLIFLLIYLMENKEKK